MLNVYATENGVLVVTESDETIINLSGRTPKVEDSDAFPNEAKKLLAAIKQDKSLKSVAKAAYDIDTCLTMAANFLAEIANTKSSNPNGQFSKIISERSEKMKNMAEAILLMLNYALNDSQ